jgi:hypothetical protein
MHAHELSQKGCCARCEPLTDSWAGVAYFVRRVVLKTPWRAPSQHRAVQDDGRNQPHSCLEDQLSLDPTGAAAESLHDLCCSARQSDGVAASLLASCCNGSVCARRLSHHGPSNKLQAQTGPSVDHLRRGVFASCTQRPSPCA